MNLKDKCKQIGITLAEGKEKYGLTHWNQTVPEHVSQRDSWTVSDTSYHSHPPVKEVVEEVLEIVEEVKPIEVAVAKAVIEVVEDVISREDKVKSVRGLGTKSKYWSELNG